MFDLKGRGALITGASGQIGGAIARALAAQGARVVLSGTRIDALDALAAQIGPDCAVQACDLTQKDAVDGLVAAAGKALDGSIDILVSNAGITRDGLLARMKDDDWEQVMRLNLDVYFRLARAALRPMMRHRHGRIIGISSVVGVVGNAGQTNYVASKAGMIGFSKALAHEVASRAITVNCVAPGFIVSPMTDALPQSRTDAMTQAIPARRLGTAADIAAAVAYLASDEAGYVTGQTLHINGGMAMI